MEKNSHQGADATENVEPAPVNGDTTLFRPSFLSDGAGEFGDDFDLEEEDELFEPSNLLADLSKIPIEPELFLACDDDALQSSSWWDDDDDEIILPDPEPLECAHAIERCAGEVLLAGVRVGVSGQMWFIPVGDFPVKRGDMVLVELEQGPSLAQVVNIISKKEEPAFPVAKEDPGMAEGLQSGQDEEISFQPKMLSPASADDIFLDGENRRMRLEAMAYCKGCIRKRNLDMKLVDVELLHDRSKVIFYFTAPARIDFRDLVKDLVRNYRTRIELRQIGVRNEAQMIGGVGNCGMVACCHQYLRKFAPVTIKMAKEQNLFLNPGKLSGMCGRLLCCLSFEQPNYEEFNRIIPKMGKKYQIDSGLVKVLRANMFNMSVTVADENGEEREILLDEWKEMQPKRAEHFGNSQPHPPVQHARGAAPRHSDGEVDEGQAQNGAKPLERSSKSRRKRAKLRE